MQELAQREGHPHMCQGYLVLQGGGRGTVQLPLGGLHVPGCSQHCRVGKLVEAQISTMNQPPKACCEEGKDTFSC